MSTYTQILYQIVYGTKRHEHTMKQEYQEELYKYINGILKSNKCHVYRINGVEDHLHIVTHLHPTVALSDLVKDIKMASTSYIKSKKLFPLFNGWQDGFGAFTYTIKEKDRLIEYVKNQKEHHKSTSFKDEYRALLKENGVEFDEKYLL
jgi:putative transposase